MSKRILSLGISVLSILCQPLLLAHNKPTAPCAYDTENGLHFWVETTTTKLNANSKIAKTSKGPIEYAKTGSGPVVLCIHGSPGGYDQSLLIGQKLIDRGFTVIAVSRPGYLRTPLSVGRTVDEQADAMVALLDKLEITRAAVLGFSSGASVAFKMAERHPERVWGLVLQSMSEKPSNAPLYTYMSGLINLDDVPDLGAWLIHLSTRHDLHATVQWAVPLDNHGEEKLNARRIRHILRHDHQQHFLSDLIHTTIPLKNRIDGLLNDLENGNHHWPTANYEGINAPTAVIHGDSDKSNRYILAKKAAKRIVNSRLITAENAGHFIWLGENTKEWETELVHFLRGAIAK